LGQGFTNYYGMIGAFQTPDRRYLDFVDGSIMTDGFLNSVAGQFFNTVYGTGTDIASCMMINPDGNIQGCGSANVLCEKKLIKETLMCLDKTNLTGIMLYNSSSEITVPFRFTASMCTEYCRGNDTTGYQYAIVSETTCTCGTQLLFNASAPDANAGYMLGINFCGLSAANTLIGKDVNKSKIL